MAEVISKISGNNLPKNLRGKYSEVQHVKDSADRIAIYGIRKRDKKKDKLGYQKIIKSYGQSAQRQEPQPATWSSGGVDRPVTVVGAYDQQKDGETYLRVHGSDSGVPASQVRYESATDPVAVVPVNNGEEAVVVGRSERLGVWVRENPVGAVALAGAGIIAIAAITYAAWKSSGSIPEGWVIDQMKAMTNKINSQDEVIDHLKEANRNKTETISHLRDQVSHLQDVINPDNLNSNQLANDTIYAETPDQFVQGAFELLERQDINSSGVTETNVNAIVNDMDNWQVVSGMETAPGGGLQQHIVDFPVDKFGNHLASDAQGFQSTEQLADFMELAQDNGVTFTRAGA